jgi:phage gp29-like protein
MARKAKYNKKGRIYEGGITQTSNLPEERRQLDIILQSPEVFHFDINKFMQAYNSASAIDCYNRARLYDMYESAMMDLHLSGLIDKRKDGVSLVPIEFRRDGKPDDIINEQIQAPWFSDFVEDILMTKFYGYGLFQFVKDGEWISYYKVPYKHFDPVRREILRYEYDSTGEPLENFDNILYVGKGDRDLGLMAKIVPMVLYKRGNFGDWANYCQIFGIPIREYTYDAGDEETRQRLIRDARRQGANAVYIHPKDSNLNIIDSATKQGSSELFKAFNETCNIEMSIAVLGNTLTTAAQSTGSEALGSVHAEEENKKQKKDRQYILNVLNYEMTDIFESLGFNVRGGKFAYVESKNIDTTAQIAIVEKLNAMGLPISDDYLYETFNIEKPEAYDEIKAQKAAEKARQEEMRAQLEQLTAERLNNPPKREEDETGQITNRLKNFFGLAPEGGAL